MKKSNYIVVFIWFSMIVGIWYLFFYNPRYSWLIDVPLSPYVFSHRWFGIYWPDNSLSWALEAMNYWFYWIDVDAQMTKDGKVVIFHDLSVDRLTQATGKVRDKTLVELASLDLATKFESPDNTVWSWSYVASFEDFVREITPKWVLMVELKVPGIHNTGMEKEIIRIIEKYKAIDKVYLSSFNPVVLYRLKKINPKIRTVMISMDTNWNPELIAEIRPEDRVDLPWILRQEWIRTGIRKIINPDALSINHETEESTIDALIWVGYPVFLWTIDEKERIEWAKTKNPHSIITDDPHWVNRILNVQ